MLEIQSGEGEPAAKKPRKEHRCDTCGKTFTCPNHLESHQRIHTGEKLPQCPRCDKSFQTKSNLNNHLKAHDKRAAQRTFTGNTCHEAFTTSHPSTLIFAPLISINHRPVVSVFRFLKFVYILLSKVVFRNIYIRSLLVVNSIFA